MQPHLRPSRSWLCTSTTARRCLSHLRPSDTQAAGVARQATDWLPPLPKPMQVMLRHAQTRHSSATSATAHPAHRMEMNMSSAKPQNTERQRAWRKPRRLSRSSVACACACTQALACGWEVGRGDPCERLALSAGPDATASPQGPCNNASSAPGNASSRGSGCAGIAAGAAVQQAAPCCTHSVVRSALPCPPPLHMAAHPRLHGVQLRIEVQGLQVPRVVRVALRNAAAAQQLVLRAPAGRQCSRGRWAQTV